MKMMLQSDVMNRHPQCNWPVVLLAGALIIALPPLGLLLAGYSVQTYFEFPPLTHPADHSPFSWPIFGASMLLIVGLVGAGFVFRWRTVGAGVTAVLGIHTGSAQLPWWGWLAVVWTLLAWLLAWTRFEWMRPWQALTFTPLWLGYIAMVNALTYRRVGRCMLLERPRYFLSLFPLSAAFWWSFEYLNRFVQNWHYLGAQELTATTYFWQATLPFATVLPAVLGTAELVTTYLGVAALSWPRLKLEAQDRMKWGWSLLAIGAAGLSGLGLWPDYLFPLVWMAPLLLIVAMQMIQGAHTIFDEAAQGDWQTLWALSVAALICGFFWELWNFYSLAHWEYSVPFVQGFHLFHMPLLGYAGYLPFGLECWAVADLCLARKFAGGAAHYRTPAGAIDLAQRKPTVADR